MQTDLPAPAVVLADPPTSPPALQKLPRWAWIWAAVLTAAVLWLAWTYRSKP